MTKMVITHIARPSIDWWCAWWSTFLVVCFCFASQSCRKFMDRKKGRISAFNSVFPSSRLLSIPVHICAVFTCPKSWHRIISPHKSVLRFHFISLDFFFGLRFVCSMDQLHMQARAQWSVRCLLLRCDDAKRNLCFFINFREPKKKIENDRKNAGWETTAAETMMANAKSAWVYAPHYSSSHHSYITVHVYRTFTCKFMDNVRFYERSPNSPAKWEPQNCWISITWHSELAFGWQWERANERKTPTKSNENETASALCVCVCVWVLNFFPFCFHLFDMFLSDSSVRFMLHAIVVVVRLPSKFDAPTRNKTTIAWNEKQHGRKVCGIWNWECAHTNFFE